MKVLLSALIGSDNLGDEAIAEIVIRRLEDHENVQLTVLSKNINRTRKIKSKKNTRIKRQTIKNTFLEIKKTDVLILGGGGIINDQSSVLSLAKYFSQIYAAKLFRRKVALLWVGIGPIRTLPAKLMLKKMSKVVEYSLVRDKESAEMLYHYGFDKQSIEVAYDIVINYCPPQKNDGGRGYVLFCPRDWFFLNNFLPSKFSLKLARSNKNSRLMRFRHSMLEMIEDILKGDKKIKIRAVPFYLSQDIDLINWLNENLKPEHRDRFIVEKGFLSPDEYINMCKSADFIIGMRLHSLILASLANVQIFTIVYSTKVASFIRYMGIEKLSIKPSKNNLKLSSITEKIRKHYKQNDKAISSDKILQMQKLNNKKFNEALKAIGL